MASKLYQPPKGYYDLPFTWLYDGSGLTDGVDALNQFVYLQGGYGNFILRRMVGFDRLVAPALGNDPTTGGKFQTRDRYKNPMQSTPIYALTQETGVNKSDWDFPHEYFYTETGQIQFDLFNVLRDTNPATAQLAFQGVRRMPGSLLPRPGFRARPRTFTYVTDSPPLTGLVGADAVYLRQPVNDYDFELYNIILVVQKIGFVGFGGERTDAQWTQANIYVPVTISVQIAGINTPYSFVVAGDTITVTSGTDGAGTSTTTWADVQASYNASPAAQALADLTVFFPLDLLNNGPNSPVGGIATISGTFGIPLTVPLSKLWIYDSNKVTISSVPMLDIYCDGSPGGVYQDGALVPPLYYPKDTLIQIGFYSVLTDPSLIGSQYAVHLVGRQWYPC